MLGQTEVMLERNKRFTKEDYELIKPLRDSGLTWFDCASYVFNNYDIWVEPSSIRRRYAQYKHDNVNIETNSID